MRVIIFCCKQGSAVRRDKSVGQGESHPRKAGPGRTELIRAVTVRGSEKSTRGFKAGRPAVLVLSTTFVRCRSVRGGWELLRRANGGGSGVGVLFLVRLVRL